MAKTVAERHAKLHDRAMTRFDKDWIVARIEREQARRDRRFAFIRGAQWEGAFEVGEDGEDTGASRMEIPKFLRPIRKMRGEYRAARKQVDFRPKGDADRADADNLDGLYRADLNDSPAGPTAAQDNAFNEASAGGYGGWRLRARYEDEGDEANEHQRIGFEPIYDADESLFFDGDSKHQDKSDAKYAFLLFTVSRAAFQDQYPDALASTIATTTQREYDWARPDTVTLAEYFEVEDRSVLRRTFRQTVLDEIEAAEPDEQTYDDTELRKEREDGGTLEGDLLAKGYTQVRSRKIKRQRVRKYLLSGNEVLEDEGYIAGEHIPLVPFFFEREVIEGVERVQGMVRPVIDSVRLLNLSASQVADTVSGPADATPVVAPEQVDTAILDAWATRKTKRPAVLLLKPIYNETDGTIAQAGPSQMLEPAAVPQSAAAMLQFANDAVSGLMGEQDQPQTVPANTSAQAIQLVNDDGDVSEYLWHDNFALAVARSGRIWLSMAKELYIEEGREMIAIGADGGQSKITLAEPRHDDGGQYFANDLTTGTYDVIVDVGPATKTRQDATVRSMLGIAQVYATAGNTDAANAAVGVAVLNMEGEAIEGFQAYTRRAGVSGGWVEPTEEEAAQLEQAKQSQAPDPNALTAQANMLLAQADATATLASIDRDDREQILKEVTAEVDSDRADDKVAIDAGHASAAFERHDRDMMGVADGNAG